MLGVEVFRILFSYLLHSHRDLSCVSSHAISHVVIRRINDVLSIAARVGYLAHFFQNVGRSCFELLGLSMLRFAGARYSKRLQLEHLAQILVRISICLDYFRQTPTYLRAL